MFIKNNNVPFSPAAMAVRDAAPRHAVLLGHRAPLPASSRHACLHVEPLCAESLRPGAENGLRGNCRVPLEPDLVSVFLWLTLVWALCPRGSLAVVPGWAPSLRTGSVAKGLVSGFGFCTGLEQVTYPKCVDVDEPCC